jgi:penicillin amidase
MRYGLALVSIFCFAATAHADGFFSSGQDRNAVRLTGLHASATVLRDVDGIPHIYAADEHDALYLEGYLHAQDRLFQMDVQRRTASGTLAELLGASSLGSDVVLRTIGLRRAAERSLAAYSADARAGLQAYADGVNAWVRLNRLPSEYDVLEVTRFEPWSALDSLCVTKALSFQLSFEVDLDLTLLYSEYQRKLTDLDPQGGPQVANELFFQDLFRSAPFDPASSVPDANSHRLTAVNSSTLSGAKLDLSESTIALLKNYRSQISRVPLMQKIRSRAEHEIGSNAWVVAGRFTSDGRAMLANDPHLSLGMPATFYDLHITAYKEGLDSIGSSVAGIPWMLLGQNKSVAWGLTTTGFDVTDTYQEQVVADPSSASGWSTVYQGRLEPVEAVPVQFRINLRDGGAPDSIVPVSSGVPRVVSVVPRRNHGPILQLDPASGAALSVQWTGFGPTRELEAFRLMVRARNLKEFKDALQYFDVGSQNVFYGDTDGNVGYFAAGEVPIREDLQQGVANGAPPWFVRNGLGGNEWVRIGNSRPHDGSGYAYLPFKDLPQVVNPQSGFVVNSNNDPSGVTLDNDPLNKRTSDGRGIYYLGYSFDHGARAARITQVLRQRIATSSVDPSAMRALQADVALFDAQVFVPYIVAAFASAGTPQAPGPLQTLARDPQVAEAVQRLSKWDYTTPTGVSGGYDAADGIHLREFPANAKIKASIAATIYSVWRGQAIKNGVDRKLEELGLTPPGSNPALKALRHLIEQDGIGTSTIDFFGWTSLSEPAQRRDYILLKSLRDALDLLAGPAFEAAYSRSTNQNDYRWGRLHRVTFDSILGTPFSVPGSTQEFPPTFDGLPGIAIDGGAGTVDVGPHDFRAANANAFMFSFGPNRRYVGAFGAGTGSIEGESILPGGNVAIITSKFYVNQLGRWLTNETYTLRQRPGDVARSVYSRQVFVPEKRE